MFRCENCGSGYSAQAASSWSSCPRCLAKEKILAPLTFELGWHGAGEPEGDRPEQGREAVGGARTALR